jgi:hypothetical protein
LNNILEKVEERIREVEDNNLNIKCEEQKKNNKKFLKSE